MPVDPLSGRRVVVTRSVEQAADFRDLLERAGAEAIVFPVIRFAPLEPDNLETAIDRLESFDWLLLTSANAVHFFFERLEATGPDWRDRLPPIGVVGGATGRVLEEYGVRPAFVPEEFVGEELVDGLGELVGRRVLLPRARIGRPEIVARLRERGAEVEELALYDTVRVRPSEEALAQLRSRVDAVTFTSPSSVRNFLGILDDHGIDWSSLGDPAVACIGPVTAEAASERGLDVDLVPESYTVPDLLAALRELFAERQPVAEEAR